MPTFQVESVEEAFASALRAGATEVAAPQVKPWGQHLAYVRDPEGLIIELAKWVGIGQEIGQE